MIRDPERVFFAKRVQKRMLFVKLAGTVLIYYFLRCDTRHFKETVVVTLISFNS